MSTWLGECEGSAGIKGPGVCVAASHLPRAIPLAQQVCRAAVPAAEEPASSSPQALGLGSHFSPTLCSDEEGQSHNHGKAAAADLVCPSLQLPAPVMSIIPAAAWPLSHGKSSASSQPLLQQDPVTLKEKAWVVAVATYVGRRLLKHNLPGLHQCWDM